jgi:hypothetical protein
MLRLRAKKSRGHGWQSNASAYARIRYTAVPSVNSALCREAAPLHTRNVASLELGIAAIPPRVHTFEGPRMAIRTLTH